MRTRLRIPVTMAAVATMIATPALAQARGNLTAEERARQQAEQERRLQEELRAPRPIDAFDSVWIEDLTWMEVRDAIAAGRTTVIVPTGGVEQNGPYLVTGKHNVVLEAACEGIARKLGDALCAPIVAFVPEGDIEPKSGMMRYPGTISLKEETYRALLDDIGSSLKAHGFEHIIYIGDSGGNQTGMDGVAKLQNERWGTRIAHFVPEFYRYADVFAWMDKELDIREPAREGIHDDFVITSIMMTVDPTTVRYDQRVRAGKASINGLPIAPKEQAIETGKKLLQFRVDTTVEAIRAARGR
ncbi:MAG: creatininase family protein [Gemmatimonadetes bacterium]|nr:creatininase family protein [Gemmatimonadota bacterium]